MLAVENLADGVAEPGPVEVSRELLRMGVAHRACERAEIACQPRIDRQPKATEIISIREPGAIEPQLLRYLLGALLTDRALDVLAEDALAERRITAANDCR